MSGLTDGTTYYVIQDYADPRLMRLTTVSAAQAIATAAAGTANYNAQYNAAYTAAYNAYVSMNPGDPSLVQDATNAGNAAAQAALVQANNGEDWTAAAIESARVGNPPPVGTFSVTINSAGQVDFGFDAGFVNNEPLVYEGPAAGYAGNHRHDSGRHLLRLVARSDGQPRPRPVPRRQWQPRAGVARLGNDNVRDVRSADQR